MKKLNYGVLTSGGDCPGLNAVIRDLVRYAHNDRAQIIGFRDSWQGLLDDDSIALRPNNIDDIQSLGGTILGSSKAYPLSSPEQMRKVVRTIKKNKLSGLFVTGGEASGAIAQALWNQYRVPAIVIPKTIDNDMPGTEMCIGFSTAVSTVVRSIDQIRTTSKSHSKVDIVEVMGRHTGWLALYSGIAGGADLILIPEVPYTLKDILKVLEKAKKRGKRNAIIVVSEDAHIVDEEGSRLLGRDDLQDKKGQILLSGLGDRLRDWINARVPQEVRCTVLGYIQRGGSPDWFDRWLAFESTEHAYRLMASGKVGRLVVYNRGRVSDMALSRISKSPRTVPLAAYQKAAQLFG